MNYLAKYDLRYQSTSEIFGIRDVQEALERKFRHDNSETVLDFANKLGMKVVDEINHRYDCGNATIKLERLLQFVEVPIR
jgi:hypothetical protein